MVQKLSLANRRKSTHERDVKGGDLMDKIEVIGSVARELLAPVAKRAGLYVAGVLVTYGVAAEHADTFVSLSGALLAVSVQIGAVLYKRKKRNA